MGKIVIILLSLSMAIASENNIQNQMDGLMRFLQYKYQISGPEDLYKLDSKRQPTVFQSNSNRDMSDLLGDWSLEYQNVGINVTVGTDQTVPMAQDLMALDSANGVITANLDGFETELVYLVDNSFMDGGGGYYDSSYNSNCLFLELTDDSCDGWSGAYWVVTDSSGDTIDGDFDVMSGEGCSESTDMCFDTGDYTFHCIGTGEDTDDEISWILYDQDYNEVGNGGAGDSVVFYIDNNGGGESGSSEILLMNLDLMNYMMMMFGMPIEGIDTLMMVIIDQEEDDVIAQTITFSDDSASASIFFGSLDSSVSIDSITYSISMDNLVLSDPYGGSEELLLNGTLAPDMMDLIAGVEVEMQIPGFFLDGELEELRLLFNEDSTGMDIESDADPYYTDLDTTFFTWYVSNDSLYMITEEYNDYYYDDNYRDTTVLAYMFDGDTLIFSQMFYPCDYYDYEYYEDCINEIDDEMISMLLAGVQDIEGLSQYMEYAFIPTQMVSIEEGGSILPNSLTLHPAYPNPFNPVTNIRFDVGAEIKDLTILKVYDISGRNIATLANGYYTAGTYEVRWDASEMASGVYFTELISGSFRETQKIILLK